MSKKQPWKVVITDYNYADLSIEKEELSQWNAQVTPAQCATPEEVVKVGKDADALISQYAPITAEVIASLDRCKVIGRYGIGVDNIDVAAATGKGIAVINVPSYCEGEVSDHALAMLLAWARRIPHYTEEIRYGSWDWKTGCPIHRLEGRVLGLLGFGKIARLLAHKAKALGLEIVAYDPYLAGDVFEKEGVKRVTIDGLFAQSDFISVHVPLTSETYHLVDARAFTQMKVTACIINTSRGAVIDEEALANAIQKREIAGACLDVMEEEPPSNTNPLLTLPQVLLSPHVGWYSEESQAELRRKIAKDVGRAINGIRPQGLVNKELTERFGEK